MKIILKKNGIVTLNCVDDVGEFMMNEIVTNEIEFNGNELYTQNAHRIYEYKKPYPGWSHNITREHVYVTSIEWEINDVNETVID